MPLPRSYYPITACPCANQITRTADNELLLRGMGAYYLASGDENMFQSPGRAWAEKQAVELEGMTVRTEQVIDGRPSALRVTFEEKLEDPSYVFLAALPGGIVRWAPPALGTQVMLPRAAEPNWSTLEHYRDWKRVEPVPEMLHYGSIPAFLAFDPSR
jgi:hypothetical protein